MERHALVDQPAVVIDRQDHGRGVHAQLHRLRLAEVAQVLEERLASLVAGELGRHQLRAGRDVRQEVVADERLPGVVVDEHRVRRRMARAEDDAQRSATGDDPVCVPQRTVGLEASALVADVGEERLRRLDDLLGDAVVA